MKAALLTQTEMALSHTPREYTGMKHRLTWLTNNNHINLFKNNCSCYKIKYEQIAFLFAKGKGVSNQSQLSHSVPNETRKDTRACVACHLPNPISRDTPNLYGRFIQTAGFTP